MSHIGYDKRRHERQLFFHKIEYCSGLGHPDDICDGSIINISESGLCMYTGRKLGEGDVIEIMTALPVPCQKATARWTVRYFNDLYKTGVAFTDYCPAAQDGATDDLKRRQ